MLTERLMALPERLLAGVSGGADSVALLRLLLDAGRQVTAVHVNHALRYEASDGDEAFVRELCARWNVPLLTYRADPPDNPGEDWARRVRYSFFREAAEATGVHVIALAHHRDDQAETLLLHLLRGSGLTGLTGMAADTTAEGLRIVRPLLPFSRGELREYLTSLGQSWREDATNDDPRYLRNALRLDVLPRLEALVPGAAARLAHTADVLREEDGLLAGMADGWLACHTGSCLLLSSLRTQKPAMQRRILRAWWLRETGAPVTQSLNAAQTEALVSLIGAKAGSRCNLPGSRHGFVGWTHLHLLDGNAPAMAETPLTDSPLVRIEPADGRTGDGRVTQAVPAAMLASLTVRYRQQGDWLRPFGSSGRQSLQDYLVNRRVDAPFRDRVPLICRGSEVLLVGGVGAGDVPRMENYNDAVLLCLKGEYPWHLTNEGGN